MNAETLRINLPSRDPDATPGSGEEAVQYRLVANRTPHCSCGRFARGVGERYYYNGEFDCYSYDVYCTRCGLITVECV